MTSRLSFPIALLVVAAASPGAAEIPFGPIHAAHAESAVEELYEADDLRIDWMTRGLGGQDVERIEIDACVDPRVPRISARAKLWLSAEASSIELRLNEGFAVLSVTGGDDGPLEFFRDGSVLEVRPRRASRGSVTLSVSYEGMLEPGGDVWLRDGFVLLGPNAHWYPMPRQGDRCEFRMVVRYPDGYTSVGTGSLAGMTPSRSAPPDPCALGDVWDTRVPVESAAVAVGRFSTSLSVWGNVLLGYHVLLRPGEEGTSGVDASAAELKRLVRFLESCYGPYPFEWLNVISVPGSATGTQSTTAPGMAVWDTDWIREEPVSPGLEGAAASLTRSWWQHSVDATAVLSEGLAAHSEISLLRETGDEEGAVRLREFCLGQYVAALADSGGRATLRGCIGPEMPVDARICGCKGGAVLELLEHLIGRDAFCAALGDLGERFRTEAAPLRDVVRAFEDASGSDLDWFVYEWVYRPGLPTYVLDYETIADGKGYAVRGTIRQDGEIYRTPVPLTIDFGIWSYEEWIAVESPEQTFEFRTELEPLQIVVDGDRLIPQIARTELARLHFERGSRASAANEWGTAVDEFGAAAELEPESAQYRYSYGEALVHSGRLVLGLEELESSVELAPDDPDIRISLARLQLRSGLPAAALSHLEAYVTLREDDPAGHAQMALALIGLGRLPEAHQSLAVADTLAADSAATPMRVLEELRLAEGRFHEASGDTALAVEAYEAALRLNRVSDEARRRLREISGVDE